MTRVTDSSIPRTSATIATRSPRGRRAVSSSCWPRSTGATRSTRASSTTPASARRAAAAARRSRAAAADDQERAGRRSGSASALGHGATEPIERYTRYSQTSSTTGRPLRWLDTNESWQWMLDCWKAVYRAARVGPGDRIFFAVLVRAVPRLLDGVRRRLADRRARHPGRRHVEPAAPGDDRRRRRRPSSAARRPTRCGWPRSTAEAERPAGGRWRRARVRVADRRRRAGRQHSGDARADRASWGARVIDQHGLTEVGPVSFECWEQPGCSARQRERVHLRGARSGRRSTPVADGQPGELRGHQSRPDRQPGDPLPHRRRRRPAVGAVRVRPDVGAARRRHHRAHRRHGEHPRRERLSGRHRVGRPPLRGGRRVPVDGVAGRAPCDRWPSRSSWRRRRRIRGRSPRASRSGCARRWA